MTNRISYSHSAPSTSYYLEADQYDQDADANTSRVKFRIFAINNGNYSSESGYPGEHYGYIGGVKVCDHTANPFLPSGVGPGANRWVLAFVYPTVTHDADGVGSVVLRQYVHSTDSDVGTSDKSYTLALTRIPQAPGAPGTPSFSGIYPTSATVSWTAAARGHANITDYYLQVATSASFDSGFVHNGSLGAVLTQGVGSLAPGTTYYARTRASNGDGSGAWSAASGFTTPGVPAKVGTPGASGGTGEVALTWVAPSDGGTAITGYTLQYATNGSFSGASTLNLGTGLSRTVTGMSAGTLYYFRVAAVNAAGTGAYSDTANATTNGVPSKVGTPGASGGVTTADLVWVAPSNGGTAITGYAIEYATNAGFSGSSTKDVGAVTSDTVTGLTSGLTYYFRVAAKNAVGTGAKSDAVSAFLGAKPSTMATPTLTMGAGLISVVWVAPAAAPAILDYRIHYSTDPTFASYALVDPVVSAREATLTGLTPGSTYYVRIFARNSVGYSTASAVASGIIPARGALESVLSAAVHVSGGVQVELRSNGAATPTITLGYIAFGSGTTFVSIATLPAGSGSGDYAVPGGHLNLALVADSGGDLYVIGRRGDSTSAVLVRRYERTGPSTWAYATAISQALPDTGSPLVAFAAAFAPGSGGSPKATLVMLARRAGTVGAGALSYATLDLANIAAGSGALFVSSGSDPSWLSTPPTSEAPNTGTVDVAPLTPLGSRFALFGNGYAVIDVVNGVVSSVSKAANGSATAGPVVRVIGVSSTTFAVLTATVSGQLERAFYSSNGSELSRGYSAGSDAYGGAWGSKWAAYYDRIAQVVRVYFMGSEAGARVLKSWRLNTSTYTNDTPTTLTSALGAASSANGELRAPSGVVDERRVLVAAANLLTGTKSVAAYVDTSGNVAPNSPAMVLVDGFDASDPHTMAWAFSDPNPADTQSAYELQVQRVSDSVNVVNTGKVAGAAATRLIAGATLANGVAYRWRVRAWDVLDTAGAWTSYDAFTPAAIGTLTITAPLADNPVGVDVASYPLAWTYSQTDGYVQTQRRVKVVRVSDSVVLSDTTMQASVATSYATPLPTDVPVRIELSIVTNAPGTPTVSKNRLITSSYGTPMAPLVTLSAGASFVTVAIDNPTPSGSKPEVIGNLIDRRRTDSGEGWVSIALVEYNGSYNDHAVRSGVSYDYRVRGQA